MTATKWRVFVAAKSDNNNNNLSPASNCSNKQRIATKSEGKKHDADIQTALQSR